MPTPVAIVFGGFFTVVTAYSLGNVCLRTLPAPRTIALAVGVAVESLIVFLLLLAGAANGLAFAGLGALSLVPLFRVRRPLLQDPVKAPLDRVTTCLLAAVFSAYGVLYFVHALAPEIQPDGYTYHLGLVAEYGRLGKFPKRVGFYETLPQGAEMLFLFAFAFGRHSAAKLVHFTLLLATLPLMAQVGRRLHLSDTASALAAVLYFCAPVVGVTGTASYNDAALVFFVLATFYLLLVWRQERDDRYLAPAGLTAGFCYAIKYSGAIVLPAAVLFVLAGRLRKRALVLTAYALVMIAPWALRDAALVGNPVAPLFNRWFPNPYFHAATEQNLAQQLRSYGGATLWDVPYQLTLGGGLQGILGPLLLVLPLGLLALRRGAGRLCWLAAALLALPWFWNTGTRFLMPALPFLALALAMILPRPAAWACLVIQAVTCWPQVIDLYDPSAVWRLREFPLSSALRIEREPEYLWRKLDEFKIARMVETDAVPGEKIFALMAAPKAYLDREVLESWHSAQADQLAGTLLVAGRHLNEPLYDLEAVWPAQLLRGLRFRLTARHPGEWCIHEVRLYSGNDQLYNSPQWLLRAWPNPWEVPVAFDDNLATYWRTWETMRPGMYLEVDLDRPQALTSALLVSTPVYGVPVEFFGLSVAGQWRLLSNRPRAQLREREDLRKPAVQALKRAGFRYILVPASDQGYGPLGKTMVGHEAEWGIEPAGQAGKIYLFRIP